MDTENSGFTYVCTPLTRTLSTCVNYVIPQFFASVKVHSNGCCTPVFDTLTAATGETPSVLMPDLVAKVADLACTTRTPGFPALATQTYGYNAVQVFADPRHHACGVFPERTRMLDCVGRELQYHRGGLPVCEIQQGCKDHGQL